jgi:hypothetical protein
MIGLPSGDISYSPAHACEIDASASAGRRLDRDLDDLRQEIPLHRRIERGSFLLVAHAEQHAGAFPMEIEGRVEINHHDVRGRYVVGRR